MAAKLSLIGFLASTDRVRWCALEGSLRRCSGEACPQWPPSEVVVHGCYTVHLDMGTGRDTNKGAFD